MIRKVLLLGAVGLLLGASSAFALVLPPINLTEAGAEVTSTDGTIWVQVEDQPTGTGVFDPFLRLHAQGIEEGMNTSGDAGNTYDDIAGIWTHEITVEELGVVTIGTTDYYQFTLDLGEPAAAGKNLISLDELRIYTLAGNSSLTTEADVLAAGGTERYDLDQVSDQDVYLDYNLVSSGNGNYDAYVYIPTSYFSGASGTDFIYFYSKMGATTGMEADFASDGTFEEWSAFRGEGNPPDELPEPSTVMLLGTGLIGLAATRIRRK
jgi:hypothetical protein